MSNFFYSVGKVINISELQTSKNNNSYVNILLQTAFTKNTVPLPITIFGDNALSFHERIHEGNLVVVSGYIRVRKRETADGRSFTNISIICDDFETIESIINDRKIDTDTNTNDPVLEKKKTAPKPAEPVAETTPEKLKDQVTTGISELVEKKDESTTTNSPSTLQVDEDSSQDSDQKEDDVFSFGDDLFEDF